MPEKHPGASTIGSKPQDGDRSPLLANPENPAMLEPPRSTGETQAPITLIKSGEKRRDKEGKVRFKAQSMHRMLRLGTNPEPFQKLTCVQQIRNPKSREDPSI